MAVWSDAEVPGLETLRVPSVTGFQAMGLKAWVCQQSPFDVSVLVDDDCVIHRGFGSAVDRLAGLEVAMVPDVTYPTLGKMVKWKKPGQSPWVDAVLRWARFEDPSVPYFSSGVIVWRRTRATAELLSLWAEQWQQVKGNDQYALATAIKQSGVPVATMPRAMNYVLSKPATEVDLAEANVLHFWKDKVSLAEAYARLHGFEF